jgi:signal peptidase I
MEETSPYIETTTPGEVTAKSEHLIAEEPTEQEPVKRPEKKRIHPWKILSGISTYFIFALLIFAAFLYGAKPGTKNILGFSYANVLTDSMQSEIPEGSLVLVKHVDPAAIKVGDDVTYIRPDNSTVTHKVMVIYENYQESGQRGFVTQGVMYDRPDPDVVYGKNVIGRVQFHIAHLGAILSYIADRVWMIAGLFVIFLLLTVTLRIFFKESMQERNAKEAKAKHMRTHAT